MSLDAIQQIIQAEADAKQRKTEAVIAAKKLIADAEQAGKEALNRACSNAETKTKEFLSQAENRAAERAAEIAAQTERNCAALRRAAEKKLDKAAALIVRRVVGA